MLNKFFWVLFCFSNACYGQILDQLSTGKDDSPVIIDAEQSIVCDEPAHKCIATGLAKAQKGTSIVYGDVLTVYFTEGNEREITEITAEGNVRMETPKETAYGEHAHYDAALDRVIMTGGNLKIVTPKEIHTARDAIEYWHTKNQGIARGDAVAEFPEKNQRITADTLVADFKPSSEKEKDQADVHPIEVEGNNQDITAITADGHVVMETPKETAYGDHAHYDAALDRVLLTGGDLKVVTPKETLTATDSLEYWRSQNKGIAKGNAVAKFTEKKQLVRGDTLTAYLKPTSEKTEDGEPKMEIDRIEAEGNVLASGPNGIATGDRGVYVGATEIVEMFDNVKITKGENLITGEYGRANLKTNFAEVFPGLPNSPHAGPPKRISGVIIPKDAKKRRHEMTGVSEKESSPQRENTESEELAKEKDPET